MFQQDADYLPLCALQAASPRVQNMMIGTKKCRRDDSGRQPTPAEGLGRIRNMTCSGTIIFRHSVWEEGGEEFFVPMGLLVPLLMERLNISAIPPPMLFNF